MAYGSDGAVVKDLLDGQLELARQVIADVKVSPRDAGEKQHACEQVVAGLTLAVGILIAREWHHLTYEERMRLQRVYSDAIGALGVFA